MQYDQNIHAIGSTDSVGDEENRRKKNSEQEDCVFVEHIVQSFFFEENFWEKTWNPLRVDTNSDSKTTDIWVTLVAT